MISFHFWVNYCFKASERLLFRVMSYETVKFFIYLSVTLFSVIANKRLPLM